MKPLKIVAVSAGLGVPSSTRLLADRLAEATRQRLAGDEPARAVEVRVVELRDLATDIAHNMVTGFPSPALGEAVEAVTEADGLIAVTPIFTASYSGLFKSFFDVIDNAALTGKPVLIAATGGTARHSLALEHALRPLFAYLRAVVVPTAVYAASEDWGTGGSGPGGALTERIDRAAGELAALALGRAATAPAAEPADDAFDVVPFAEQLAALRAN
ncbi:CE1759 family FMN reductase [Streptomyces sp. NPDC050315]|uniref:CE1759 family FMN reductase n=1 Tax=Streptomyces sp. NPDC050315 TaxID=3155039 RepID=UPI003412A071